jgi:predicted DNA-binding transcriptional regulator YafY
MNRTERLASIEQMLLQSVFGMRAVEIAAACSVDRRTIYRDLAMLNKVGIPVYQKGGRFYVHRDFYHAPVRLNTHEAIALFLACRAFIHHAVQPTPYFISALNKLANALPNPLADHMDVVITALSRAPVDRGFISVLNALTNAWSERRKVKLWHSGDAQAREFSTFFLESTPDGEIYAVGMDALSASIRAFNLRNVKRVKPMLSQFDLPTNFPTGRYLAQQWGIGESGHTEVVLLFAPEVANAIRERLWHLTQQINTLENGQCRFSVRVDRWETMLPWIRTWGDKVEVFAPSALREAVYEEAQKLLSLYVAKTG